jgi:uncharacterized protein
MVERTYTAFAGDRLIGAGPLQDVLAQAKRRFDRGSGGQLLIFEDQTGQQLEFDLRGTLDEVLARELPPPRTPGPGRPKLGVVSREVSLLPRHWEWLEAQPNGISAALRRLVDTASKREPGQERARRLRAAASRVMSALAGNLPNFEEASRALFAQEQERFEQLIRRWPKDVRTHFERLSRECVRLAGKSSGADRSSR